MDLKLNVCPEREGIKQERDYVSHKEESGRMTIDRDRRSGHTQKRHTEWASSHQAREKTCKFLELEVPWNHILVSVFLRHYGWNSLRVHFSHCYVCLAYLRHVPRTSTHLTVCQFLATERAGFKLHP